jgi:hypothetical protein
MGVVLIVELFLSCPARAHTPGLSVADFDVHSDGEVEAHLIFATAQPLAGISLDRDRDGVVTDDDIAVARDDLSALLVQGVEVLADGSPCAPTFRDAQRTEVDAVELRGSYACPADAAEIEVTLYYLSALPGSAKSPHRGIARIIAGSVMTEAILTGENRRIALRIPQPASGPRAHGAARKRANALAWSFVAVVIGILAYRARRWRIGRSAWHNRRR